MDGNLKTVTVTGANGFIASRIIYQLLKHGYKVKGTVRDPNDDVKAGFLKNFVNNHNLSLHSIPNLANNEGFDEACEGSDFVIHAASPIIFGRDVTEDEMIKPAINGVEHCFNAAISAGVKKFIHISSAAAICGTQRQTDPKHVYTEEDWNDEMGSLYSKSKTLAEKRLWEKAKEHEGKIDVVSINPTMVIGPVFRNKLSSTPLRILSIITSDEKLEPKFKVGMVDVRDIAHACIAALNDDNAKGNRYIAALTEQFGPIHVVQTVKRLFPGEFDHLSEEYKEGDKPEFLEKNFKNDSIRGLLGRDLTSFEESIRDTIESFKTVGLI